MTRHDWPLVLTVIVSLWVLWHVWGDERWAGFVWLGLMVASVLLVAVVVIDP